MKEDKDYKRLQEVLNFLIVELILKMRFLVAITTLIKLGDNYPYENHAYCEIVEVWRKLV